MLLIILCLIIPQILAKWDTPIKVVPSALTTRVIYTDSTTGLSHVVWCDAPSGNFLYRQVQADGTISNERVIALEHPCYLEHSIDGAHDGKTVYLLYHGKRKRDTDKKSCELNENNCQDIYFSESRDSGATWTTPIAVPRSNMHDRIDRHYAKLLVTRTGRLWIFYRTGGHFNVPFAYVVRAPGSATFTNEVILPLRIFTASVNYNEYNGQGIISIYFSTNESITQYRYYTLNNAIKWIGPEEIHYCKRSNGTLMRFPFNSFAMATVSFIICREDALTYTLRKTFDNGKTWIQLKSPNPLTGEFTFASDGKDSGIVAYGARTIHYMNIKDETFKEMDKPPTPGVTRCGKLTSSYNLKKYWFWYDVYDIKTRDYSTWVVATDMPTS